jgi:hypothetical protein
VLIFIFVLLIKRNAECRTYCIIRIITIYNGASRGVASEKLESNRGTAR